MIKIRAFSIRTISLISIFIMSICIKIVSSQTQSDCEQTLPTNVYSCAQKSTASNSCCFYRKNGALLCKWWEDKVVKTIVDGDLVYQCDNYRGVSCGPNIANNSTECDKSSYVTNTCCYYKDNSDVGRCMWWAEGWKGETKYLSYDVKCNSNYISSGFSILFLIAYFLI